MSTNGSAVLGTALNGAAKAHSLVALGGGEGRDLLAVDGDVLDILLGRLVVLVCGMWSVSSCLSRYRTLRTMHGDAVTLLGGSRVLVLNRELRVLSGLGESVSKDAPLLRVPVVGNRLNQVALVGAHSNPERGNTGRSLGNIGKDESRGSLTNP